MTFTYVLSSRVSERTVVPLFRLSKCLSSSPLWGRGFPELWGVNLSRWCSGP